MTRDQLRKVVQVRMRLAGKQAKTGKPQSARSMCASLKMASGHQAHLSAFLRGERAPTPALLKALGYRRVQAESYVVDK